MDSGLENFLYSVTNIAYDGFGVSYCGLSINLYPLPLPLWRLTMNNHIPCTEISGELSKIARSYSSPFVPASKQHLSDNNQQDLLYERRSKKSHRNWHQAMCKKETEDLVCTRYNFTYRPGKFFDTDPDPVYFPLILSYKDDVARVHYDQQVVCPTTHVADVVTETCTEKMNFCPIAQVSINGYCYKVSLPQDGIRGLCKSRIDIFIATSEYVNITRLPNSGNDIKAILVLYTVGMSAINWVPVNCTSLLEIDSKYCLLLVLQGPPANRLLRVANFNRYRTALFKEIIELVENVEYIGMKNHDYSDIYCKDGNTKLLDAPAVVTSSTYYFQFYETDALTIIDQKLSLSYKSTMTAVMMMWQVSDTVPVPLGVHAAVCMSNTTAQKSQ